VCVCGGVVRLLSSIRLLLPDRTSKKQRMLRQRAGPTEHTVPSLVTLVILVSK
jgi:hypothetical protein